MQSDTLSVATFNIENLDNSNATQWSERSKALRGMIERVDAQILLLQEVNMLSALDSLVKGTGYQNYHRVFTKTKAGDPYAKRNLVILSKWPFEDHKQYNQDLVPGPTWSKVTSDPPETTPKRVEWERPILHAWIRVGQNRTLHIVNIHLKSMNPSDIKGQVDPNKWWLWLSHSAWAEGFYLSDIKRVGQALEVRFLLDTIFKREGENALIVVGGDFNAEIGSVPFKTVVGSVEDTQNPSLRPTVMIPCEYNVPPDQRFTLIHHGRGNMLDHVIVSQALYPYWLNTSIFNEVLHDESLAFSDEEKFPESDHAPVIARFRPLGDSLHKSPARVMAKRSPPESWKV